MNTSAVAITLPLLYTTPPSSHPTFSVVIQRVSLEVPASSAAARSQIFIVLQREEGQFTTATEDTSGECIIATHSSKLPLSILLLYMVTHLWDRMRLDDFISAMHKISYFNAYIGAKTKKEN